MSFATFFVVLPVALLLGIAVREFLDSRRKNPIEELRRFKHDMPRLEGVVEPSGLL